MVFLRAERERDFHTLKDGHRGPVVAFSYVEKGKSAPGGRESDWLFSAGADGAIKQWDLDSMTCRATLRVSEVTSAGTAIQVQSIIVFEEVTWLHFVVANLMTGIAKLPGEEAVKMADGRPKSRV